MSWLFKTLSSDDDPGLSSSSPARITAANSPAGVKEDLSAIGLTIGRQIRGVAAFLAPPPVTESELSDEPPAISEEAKSEALSGLRSDLAEIGGSLKTGLRILSAGGISRLASSLLPFPSRPEEEEDEEEDDFDGYVPGITEDVLRFVAEISDRSECWTDFPLRLDHGFRMSDAQREHASAIEHYISDFAALREKLSILMNENIFWMIYFILLVPRLSGNDSELLSTPEIIKARDALLQKLHNKEAELDSAETSMPTNTSEAQIPVGEIQTLEQDFHKLRVSDGSNPERPFDKPTDDSGNSSAADVRFETEDDISFSDLEDDNSEVSQRLSVNKGSVHEAKTSSLSESNDWVKLHEKRIKKDSEGEDSSDWHNVDDFD